MPKILEQVTFREALTKGNDNFFKVLATVTKSTAGEKRKFFHTS